MNWRLKWAGGKIAGYELVRADESVAGVIDRVTDERGRRYIARADGDAETTGDEASAARWLVQRLERRRPAFIAEA